MTDDELVDNFWDHYDNIFLKKTNEAMAGLQQI